jgi:hypothetical protein
VKASDFWSGHEWFSVSDLVPTRCVTLLFLLLSHCCMVAVIPASIGAVT